MRSFFNCFFALTLCLGISSPRAFAEFVFLKDGAILEGEIIKDETNSILLKLKDASTKTIARNDILRLLYTELKMGKVYIQKRNGENVVAYIVAEDRKSYTLRDNLYKPQEFVLKREDILFIAEKNPSGLKAEGEPLPHSLSLSWLAPYGVVSKYNIYIKKSKDEKYTLADSAKKNKFVLENLNSNTRYFIIVTGIDEKNNESLPSNEIEVKTKNVAPSKPEGIVRHIDGEREYITWNESTDPDGKVKGYHIYDRNDTKNTIIATVPAPEYTVAKNLSIYNLQISSVDDLDTESEKVRVLMPLQLVLSLAPAALSFTGELGEMFDPGYGGTLNIGLRHFTFQNFETGISFSYLSLPGKKELNTDSMNYLSLSAYAGYHLWIGDWFSLFPFAKIGESFSKVKYTGLAGETDKTIIDPLVAAGLSLTASSDRYTFSLGADYGFLSESAGAKYFFEGFISFGLLLEL